MTTVAGQSAQTTYDVLVIGGGKMSDFRVMVSAVTDLVCAKLGRPVQCRTHRETLEGAPVNEIPFFPQPPRYLKIFLRRQPRLRELHALIYLAFAFLRHLLRRALNRSRPAETGKVAHFF